MGIAAQTSKKRWWAVSGRKVSLLLSCVWLFAGGEYCQAAASAWTEEWWVSAGGCLGCVCSWGTSPAHHLQQTAFLGMLSCSGSSSGPARGESEKPKGRFPTWTASLGSYSSLWVYYCITGSRSFLHPPLRSSKGGREEKSWKNIFPRWFSLCLISSKWVAGAVTACHLQHRSPGAGSCLMRDPYGV